MDVQDAIRVDYEYSKHGRGNIEQKTEQRDPLKDAIIIIYEKMNR